MSSLSPWQQQLRHNFTQWERLADFLELSNEQRSQIHPSPQFVLNLPRRLAEKIVKKTLDDPILRQFLPLKLEAAEQTNFSLNPVQDECFARSSSLLQKYQGRALLIPSSACAMHCRYCFRQNYPYEKGNRLFEKELAIISEDSSLQEIILSGGDPLSLPNPLLLPLIQSLAAIPHLRLLRIHSRFPMGIPERIDQPFLDVIEQLNIPVWFVLHANHAAEFDAEIFERLKALRKVGAIILHQAVLLQGVNADEKSLFNLYQLLVNHGIVPYYLHQLDRVEGAMHFEVPIEKGKQLIATLRTKLPGYAIPRYVAEIPGELHKTPL